MRGVSYRSAVMIIVGLFLAFSYVWIVTTAEIVAPLARLTGLSEGTLEIAKGLVYVTLAALLLLISLSWYARSLLATEQNWLQLAETTREGLCVIRLGERPRVVFVNPAFEAITGRQATDFSGELLLPLRLVSRTDLPTLRAIYSDPLGQRWPQHVRLVRPDGTQRWVRLSATSTRNGKGVTLLQVLIVDVTEDRRREEALDVAARAEHAAAEQLRANDRLKQTFLTAVSHELRSPVTVVSGMATTLLEHGDRLDADERRRALESLSVQSARLHRTLDDLLDVDRLERGASRATFAPLDVAELVRATVQRSPAVARVRLTAPEVLAAYGDAVQLSRIVDNLLDNAEKYAPHGPVDVELTGDGQVWRLRVADHGPGVPRAELDRIFKVFHRLDTSHPKPGTGVGLALVAEFTRIHDGHATAEVSDGLVITVEIPVTAENGTPGAVFDAATG